MLTIFSAALCSCTIVLHNKLFKLPDLHILIGCYYLLWTQATPRLTEDTVKQCIDPRLKGECPPKGVAKVCLSSSLVSLLRTPSLTRSLAKKQLETNLNTKCFFLVLNAACSGGSPLRAVRVGVQTQHEHRRQGALAPSSAETSSSTGRCS